MAKRFRGPWLNEIPKASEIFEEARRRLNVDGLFKEGVSPSAIVERLEGECHKIFLEHEEKVRERWLPKIRSGEVGVDERAFETSLANSARARAGSTAEMIIRYMLRRMRIPFDYRKFVDGEQPDIIIPSIEVLRRSPSEAVILSVKREVRERWRVSVGEAYILREVYGIKDNYWFISIGHDIDKYICTIMTKLKIRVYILNSLYEQFKSIEGVRPLSKLFEDLTQYIAEKLKCKEEC